ncbi:MAG: molecular chaperone TorD family protein [Stappiaceae bacterium]
MEAAVADSAISDENRLRADVYNFLARYLTNAPDAEALAAASALTGDETEFGSGFSNLARVASKTEAQQVTDEFNALFVGLGRGELLPYASYYLTGFLNEKPLAKLRNDMRSLGVERREGVSEPEDHIGSLMEIMGGLISGRYDAQTSPEIQRDFFMTHIEPWAGHFYRDLEAAEASRFYQPIGRIGRLFIEIEVDAFGMQ